MRRLAIMLCMIAGACSDRREFHCERDDVCVLDNIPGRCEVNGFCSFGDVVCPSGSRYGEHAPSGIAGTCVIPPGNETCGAALPLEQTTTGTLRGAGAAIELTCSPLATSEVFYSFELDNCGDVTLSAVGAGDLSLALLRDCADELACVDAFQSNASEVLAQYGLPAGSYQVAVASTGYDEELTLTSATAPVQSNDACTNALSLATGPLPVQTFARAADDLALSGRSGARDLFYALSLTDRSVIDVNVTPRAPLTGLEVALLDDACNVLSTKPVGTTPVRFGDLVPGNYKLAVDGPVDGGCGRYDLAVSTKTVAANNQCAGAINSGFGTYVVDLGPATDDYQGSCGGSGNDVVYELTLNARSAVAIGATSRTGAFRPVVYVRGPMTGGDCALAPEVSAATANDCAFAPPDPRGPSRPACVAADAGSAFLMIEELAAGTYQLIVDSEDGTGTLDLSVLVAPPLGDTSATPLAGGSYYAVEDNVCEVNSTIGANASSAPAGAAGCFAGTKPSVYRSVVIPSGCGRQNGAFVLTSPSRHHLTIEAVGACAQTFTPVCDLAPTTPSGGNYVSSLALGANPAGPCELRVGIFAEDVASEDFFQLSYRYGLLTLECTGL